MNFVKLQKLLELNEKKLFLHKYCHLIDLLRLVDGDLFEVGNGILRGEQILFEGQVMGSCCFTFSGSDYSTKPSKEQELVRIITNAKKSIEDNLYVSEPDIKIMINFIEETLNEEV